VEDGLRIQVLAWTRTVPPPLPRFFLPASPDRLGDHLPPDPNPVRPDIGWQEVLSQELEALLTIGFLGRHDPNSGPSLKQAAESLLQLSSPIHVISSARCHKGQKGNSFQHIPELLVGLDSFR